MHFKEGSGFNFDLQKHHQSRNVALFISNIMSCGLLPCIDKPTRVTTAGASSLIDNLYVKGCNFSAHAGVILSDISDHYPIILLYNSFAKLDATSFNFRPISDSTYKNIEHDLMLTDWSILNHLNVNSAYDKFLKIFQDILNRHAPLISKTISHKKYRHEPWFTKKLQLQGKKVRQIHRQCTLQPQQTSLKTDYITARNKYNKDKRVAKQNYYDGQFLKHQNNTKETWNLINNISGRKNKASNNNTVKKLTVNNTEITDPYTIVNTFTDSSLQLVQN